MTTCSGPTWMYHSSTSDCYSASTRHTHHFLLCGFIYRAHAGVHHFTTLCQFWLVWLELLL